MRNAYKILSLIPEVKDYSEGDGVDGNYNIKFNLKKMALEVVGWINMADDRDWWLAVVNTVMNLLFP